MARGRYLLSLPERTVRALVAVLGGTAYEASSLVLPRLVRRSRLYEATAKNLLRVTIELVGGVATEHPVDDDAFEADARKLAVRKTTGNVLELGSIAAFGFSPLWLLAAAADVTRGSRVYLDAFVRELKAVGVLASDARPESVDGLLATLVGTSGAAARLIDIPPLELEALRQSLAEFRREPEELPTPAELDAAYAGLRATAMRERRTLLEVSSGIGLAFFNAARHVGRQHVLDPYTEDLRPLRSEGFGAYAARVSRPYTEAVVQHFDPARATHTERAIGRLGRD